MSRFLLLFTIITLSFGTTTHSTFSTESETINTVLSKGQTLLGKPYKWSVEKRRLDCGGYISYIFSAVKITLPPSSRYIAGYTDKIPLDMAQPGDLLFFTGTDKKSSTVGHVGIVSRYIDGKLSMMHSCSRGIIEETLPTDYYKDRFLFAGRLKSRYESSTHSDTNSSIETTTTNSLINDSIKGTDSLVGVRDMGENISQANNSTDKSLDLQTEKPAPAQNSGTSDLTSHNQEDSPVAEQADVVNEFSNSDSKSPVELQLDQISSMNTGDSSIN